MLWRQALLAGQAITIAADNINRLAIRPWNNRMKAVFIPVGGISDDTGEFNKPLGFVKPVVAIGVSQAKQHFTAKVLL